MVECERSEHFYFPVEYKILQHLTNFLQYYKEIPWGQKYHYMEKTAKLNNKYTAKKDITI